MPYSAGTLPCPPFREVRSYVHGSGRSRRTSADTKKSNTKSPCCVAPLFPENRSRCLHTEECECRRDTHTVHQYGRGEQSIRQSSLGPSGTGAIPVPLPEDTRRPGR